MPKGSQHSSASLTKMLLIGESGSGKSGALASLAAADYKLRILDFDNGLDFLMRYMRKNHPDKIDNIEFVSLLTRRCLVAHCVHLYNKRWRTSSSPTS